MREPVTTAWQWSDEVIETTEREKVEQKKRRRFVLCGCGVASCPGSHWIED